MTTVYILYSPALDKYYIGSCENFTLRFQQHQEFLFPKSFTAKSDDWEIFYLLEDLEYKQARNIESHIKKMKSQKYIEDLKAYSEISQKLKARYNSG